MVEYLDPGPWPGFIGDRREKFVRITLGSGEEVEHSEVYFTLSADEFAVSSDREFDDDVTRYDHAEVARVEVLQHHSRCFITTAVAGDEATLESLRGFRDDAMARTPGGRALLWVYDAVSPPVAATLADHPDARTTGAIRRLVERCAALARWRERRRSAAVRASLSVALVLLYVVGIALAVAGHLALAARSRLNG